MIDRTNTPVVILSGGLSRRFGSNKALARLDGERLIDRLMDRLANQTSGPIVVNAPDEDAYGLPAIEFIEDEVGDKLGPLAGIHAAINYDSMVTSQSAPRP